MVQSRPPSKSGYLLCTSSGKQRYVSVQGAYFKISETKDASPRTEVRTSITKVYPEAADLCKFNIKFDKASKSGISLRAESKEAAKEWIDVLKWTSNTPPTETQLTSNDPPPPYDEPVQPRPQPAPVKSKLCHIL